MLKFIEIYVNSNSVPLEVERNVSKHKNIESSHNYTKISVELYYRDSPTVLP